MVSSIVAGNLMTTNIISTNPDAMLPDVIQQMLAHNYSFMIVVDCGKPVGIVTERDIVHLMAEFMDNRPQSPLRVAEVMSTPLTTVTEDTTLFDALVISSARSIRHLPVVNDVGALVGIVTEADLAKAHFRIFEEQRDIIENSVHERTRELQEANDQLKSLSMVDALTGLGNRRAMEVDLSYTHAQATRYNRSYAVALFDVDMFKLYNDCYGHLAGDAALRRISQHLDAAIRKCDRLYRYGGEEILLVMPETSLHGALILSDRILAGFADLNIPHEKSPYGFITLSCGVASQVEEQGYDCWEGLVDLADRGLYASKKSGRNKVTIIPPEDALEDTVPRMHGSDQ
ncbi:MAG TPA: GGDEF domain-containing protein [Desulfuromonadales bacterium]|nr:GGDEF domain-containing protein [Desulfuromonadales bacterium]